MKKIKTILIFVFITLFSMPLAGSVFAGSKSDVDEWQFNLTPFYVWLVNVEGSGQAGSSVENINFDFEDVFDLDAAFLAHFEAMHKSNWGLLIDTNYIGITGGQNFSISSALNVDFEATLVEISGLYRINKQDHTFDLIAGLRYLDMDLDLHLGGRSNLAVNTSYDWLDPLIGARWNWHFASNWQLIVRGDVGGFGVGSDLSWQAISLLDWQPFENVSFIAGYRALYEDYEDDDGLELFKIDATFHGPVLGLNFRW